MENLEQPGFQQCLQWLEIMAHESQISLEMLKALLERQVIVAEMERQKGNQCKVARELGLHRNTVHRILDRQKVSPRIGRKEPSPATPVGRRYKRA